MVCSKTSVFELQDQIAISVAGVIDGLKTGGYLHLPKGTHHYEWTNEYTVIELSGVGPV
jgi:hypothetical protein